MVMTNATRSTSITSTSGVMFDIAQLANPLLRYKGHWICSPVWMRGMRVRPTSRREVRGYGLALSRSFTSRLPAHAARVFRRAHAALDAKAGTLCQVQEVVRKDLRIRECGFQPT